MSSILDTGAVAALGPLMPHLVVAFTGVAIIVADLVISPAEHPARRASVSRALALTGLLVALASTLATAGLRGPWFDGAVMADPLSTFLGIIFLGVGLAIVAMSPPIVARFTESPAEFYALVVWCSLGNMLIAPAADLVMLFIALQLSSIPLLVLIAFDRRDPRSREAGLKYLAVVLVSTAVFLYGISLVYGQTGSTSMTAIGEALSQQGVTAVASIGLVLMLAGFGFKMSAAPFQAWAPDVYQGAPTPVTALLSVGSKLAGFALVLRFAVTALGASPDLRMALAVLAVASMTIGNLGALQQTDIKRLLAYSGIAQAGYVLVGLAAMSDAGFSALLFYLAAYAVGNLLAFAVVIGVSEAVGSCRIADLAGLARRSPLAAAAMAAALLSLAGLPLTAGFVAKFTVFFSAAQAGMFWLVIVAVANTVLAFAYYLRIVWTLVVPETDEARITLTPGITALATGGTLAVVALGVAPGPLLDAATFVARALFAP